MKRVLMTMALVSMFFTGCSSMVGPARLNVDEVVQSVEAEQPETIKFEEAAAVPDSDPEDYYRQSIQEKFENLTGEQAFMIDPAHSSDPEDIEKFEIVDLIGDEVFLYYYTTRMADSGAAGNFVHCVAYYNFKTQEFRKIHENVFDPELSSADLDSFYAMRCKGIDGSSEALFVYDSDGRDGAGYLYGSDGGLKLAVSFEQFMRACFGKSYVVTITNAVTSGDNRIYLNLVLEKEPLAIPEMGKPTYDMEYEDKDARGDELEDLDESAEKNILYAVVVYEYTPLAGTDRLLMEKDNLDQQLEAWEEMVHDVSFSSEPDAEADWEEVVAEYPDRWQGAAINGNEDDKVWVWNGSKYFGTKNDGYICTFQPQTGKGAARELTVLDKGQKLEQTFIARDKKYFELTGTADLVSYDYESVTRTCRIVTTSYDSEGELVESTESVIQSIQVPKIKKVRLADAYLEGYWLEEDYEEVLAATDGAIAAEKDGKLYWENIGGDKNKIAELNDEDEASLLIDEDAVYMAISGSGKLELLKINAKGKADDQDIERLELMKIKPFDSINGDSEYDKAFEEFMDNRMEEDNKGMLEEAGTRLSSSNVLRLELNGRDFKTKYLITSSTFGITAANTGEKGIVLSGGSWYRTWKRNGICISVGFQKDANYDSMDLPFARVYTFDPQVLLREAEAGAEIEPETEPVHESEPDEALESTADLLEMWESSHEPIDTDLEEIWQQGQ